MIIKHINERVTLINGDMRECKEYVKNNTVNLLLADPPYGISFVSNRRKEKFSQIVGVAQQATRGLERY